MGIEDRIRQEVDALGQEMAQAFAARLKAVSDQLATAAADDRSGIEQEAQRALQAAVAEARAEAEQRVGAELDRVRAESDRARAEIEQRVNAELDRARADGERTRLELEQRLGGELERARAEAEAIKLHSGQLSEELDRLKAEPRRRRKNWRACARRRSARRKPRPGARNGHSGERVRDPRERITIRETESAVREKETASRLVDALRQEKETAERDRELVSRQAAAETQRRAAEREATIAGLDRLASAFRRIDASSALAEILGVMADAAAAETARVALFVTAPGAPGGAPHFKPWRLHGFPTPPSGFDLGLTSVKDLARTGLAFAPLNQSRAGVAIPIDVGGQTVAVVYADDGDAEHAAPAGWPEAIELVARHAASRIETVTAVRTAQMLGARTTVTPDEQSARRYAKLLVSEIKMYNEMPVKLGRSHRDLFERLRPEIDRARRLFEERVPALGARQAFDDELVQILADGDATLLGSPPQARKHA